MNTYVLLLTTISCVIVFSNGELCDARACTYDLQPQINGYLERSHATRQMKAMQRAEVDRRRERGEVPQSKFAYGSEDFDEFGAYRDRFAERRQQAFAEAPPRKFAEAPAELPKPLHFDVDDVY